MKAKLITLIVVLFLTGLAVVVNNSDFGSAFKQRSFYLLGQAGNYLGEKAKKVKGKTIRARDFVAKRRIKTKNLFVRSNTTVNNLFVRGNLILKNNRQPLGTVSDGRPITISGQKEASGDWICGVGGSCVRSVPDAGTVYFPGGIKFRKYPSANLTLNFQGLVFQDGRKFVDVLETSEDMMLSGSLTYYVREYLLDGECVTGFTYKLIVGAHSEGDPGGPYTATRSQEDRTNIFPVFYSVTGSEC